MEIIDRGQFMTFITTYEKSADQVYPEVRRQDKVRLSKWRREGVI